MSKPGDVTVISKEMLPLIGEPDCLIAELSDGRQLSVVWDPQYQHQLLKLDGEEATAEQTLLSIFALEALVDEVYSAHSDWAAGYAGADGDK